MNNDPNRKCLTVTVDLSRAVWHKSNHSGANGDCVEVAGNLPGVVAVRDSKDRGAALVFTPEAWDVFIAGVKVGEFDFR
jgi:Domain of unknown function (DUF397)